MVSQSPPSEAAIRHASHGSSGAAASTAKAAGTDSCVARLVPTSEYTVSMTASVPCPGPGPETSPDTSPIAQVIRAATSAAATQCPRAAARAAASTATCPASGTEAPEIPALTAAATAAAPASATPVLCVTRLASTTRSTRLSRSAHGVAMPTGVIRMAAPLVTPKRPASPASAPASSAARARFVDGPSRSSEPRARIDSSQASSRRASSAASSTPLPSMIRFASSTACSVSSVTLPAGSPAAIGWSGGPGWNSASRPPYLATICARGSDWVGMPSASPTASP